MTRRQTQMMKGVAILLMIFLHLFNQSSNVDLCHNLIYIGGEPLALILSRAANPVAFFLILGGYGLYKVNEKGDRHRWTRVFKLYLHYWIILAILVGIGHLMHPDSYPAGWTAVISNATGFHTTYNGEMWFLLPYVILSLLAPWLFRLMAHFRAVAVVLATLFIHLCTSYCISRYGVSFLFHNYWVYTPLLVFHLLFCFSLGAMAARTKFFERLQQSHGVLMRKISWSGVIALVLINCVFKYNFFYAFLIITLLLHAPMPGWIKSVLSKLGDKSMDMWMIHSWFCYYLFHDFIYSFSYPILIFGVLTAISYICSIIIDLIARPIERILFTRSEMKAKPII